MRDHPTVKFWGGGVNVFVAARTSDYQYYAYLAKRIKSGDENAFAELYERTYRVLYRYVYYFLKDHDQVPDVLQEVYIAVFKGIPSLKMERLLLPWMKQIAYHMCCSFVREQKESRENTAAFEQHDPANSQTAQNEEDCFQPVYDRDMSGQVRAALSKLPLQVRQAFLLRYENGLKLEEVADFMDVSLATVKRSIATARKSLQEELSHLKNQV